MTSSRVLGLDASRGIAMLLVCVAHFWDEYLLASQLAPTELPQLGLWSLPLQFVPRMASPMFFLLSGITLAYLDKLKRQDAGALRIHLIDKSLFLLTVGHIAIALTIAIRSSFRDALQHGYVTDTLAICTIGTLFLLPHSKAITRLVLGLTIYLGSWTSWYNWIPDTENMILIKEIFVGPETTAESMLFYFPLLPWFGVQLVGSFIGECLAYMSSSELPSKSSKQLMLIGVAVFMTGLGIKVILIALKVMGIFELDAAHYPIVAPLQKYPPGLLYLLLFTGSAIILIGASLYFEKRFMHHRAIWLLSNLGRNAFPAFLLQYLVYYTVFHLLVVETTVVTISMAMGFLILSILLLLTMITWLDHFRIRRIWTVGLPVIIGQVMSRQKRGFQVKSGIKYIPPVVKNKF